MAVTEPQVQAAFESTDGFTDPDKARKELVKKLTPLFNDGSSTSQPLDPDLTAIAALEGVGIPERTGPAAWILRPGIHVHNQAIPATEWTVSNPFGRPPVGLTVLDDAGQSCGAKVVHSLDWSSLTVSIGDAVTGKVVFS